MRPPGLAFRLDASLRWHDGVKDETAQPHRPDRHADLGALPDLLSPL